jgi:nitrate/nitrite transport system substrate-binding protein
MSKLDRRKFIAATGAAVLAHTLTSSRNSNVNATAISQNVYASNGDIPEVKTLTLGFVPVVSSCPVIIAKAKGFFDKYGMPNVRVKKIPSWSVLRDQFMLGGADDGVDGAHLLFPMTYLLATGEISYGQKIPMYILARLNLNGQGISVPNSYLNLNLGLDSSPLKSIFAQKTKTGETVRCAVPFRRVTGDFFMRWWLAYGGIDPQRDASIIVMPPPQMVANMRSGSMEAFSCVDPWHERLISQKLGYSPVTTGELWNNHPEKALAMRAEWVDKYPKATKAVLAAVMEAQMWCDRPENKEELVQIVSQKQWIGAKPEWMKNRLIGKFVYGNGRVVENSPHLIKYWQDYASYPFKSHDLWFFTEDARWGYRSPDFDAKPIIDAVNREDLWRETAKFIGQEAAIPPSTSRGVEKFFNGLTFDPENPQAYLNAPLVRNI